MKLIFLAFILMFLNQNLFAQSCIGLFKQNSEITVIKSQIPGTQRPVQIIKNKNIKSNNPYKVLIYFHGTNSLVNMKHTAEAPFGTFYESEFLRRLTEDGYVIIAPEALNLPGFIPYTIIPKYYQAWQTNIHPYADNFEQTDDFSTVKNIFENIKNISEMENDPLSISVAGFSSGGYMASRLANTKIFASKILKVIINAASFETCLGEICRVPDSIPSWHPRTLLLSNKDDKIVPTETVELYRLKLQQQGIPIQNSYSPIGAHEWLEPQIQIILNFLKN